MLCLYYYSNVVLLSIFRVLYFSFICILYFALQQANSDTTFSEEAFELLESAFDQILYLVEDLDHASGRIMIRVVQNDSFLNSHNHSDNSKTVPSCAVNSFAQNSRSFKVKVQCSHIAMHV